MERAMSTDEKIRRAEEIYQRRRLNESKATSARVNVADSPKNYNLFKKMILQIMVCLVVYFIFFLVKNSNYIFSEDFLKNAREILSYDINLQEQYNSVLTFFEENSMQNQTDEKQEEITPPAEESEEVIGEGVTENIDEENKENENNENATENTDGAIGGAEFLESNAEELIEDSSSVSQTLTDANSILENYSLIKPLSGTITSRFGLRNPTTATVPKYHTGIDIAANTGTKFIASMEGDVVLVSSEGDYRKPY